eukprot:g20383.t1
MNLGQFMKNGKIDWQKVDQQVSQLVTSAVESVAGALRQRYYNDDGSLKWKQVLGDTAVAGAALFMAAFREHEEISAYKCVVVLEGHLRQRREELRTYALERGVTFTAEVYFRPVHRMPAHAEDGLPVHLPVTDEMCENHVCPPLYPELTFDDVDYTCSVMNDFAELPEAKRQKISEPLATSHLNVPWQHRYVLKPAHASCAGGCDGRLRTAIKMAFPCLPADRRQGLERCDSSCRNLCGIELSVQRRKDGEVVVDQHRTSSSCPMLWPLMTPPDRLQMLRDAGNVALAEQIEQELRAVQAVQRRCAQVIGVEQERIEPLQLVKYLPGQYYSPHMDTHEEPERKSSYAGEQRTHTMLVFLSDVPESDGGGHLHFPRLGLHIQPHLGDAVLWRNLTEDGQPDLRVLHEGVAPKSCEKLAMNVWVADRPFSLSAIQAWQASSSSAKPAASQFLD